MKMKNYEPVRSPIKWAGGKSRLRKLIVALIPEDHTCYVEPFGGAAWVLFAKPPSEVEVYNDIYGELVNFFRVVKTKPQEFLESFKWDLVSRQIFNELKATDPTTLSDVERAHRFFYLIMAGWGGESKEDYARFQTSISDGGGGNRLIGALKSLEQRILPVYKRLQGVIIEHLDWSEILEKYDSPKTVFYMDPPYPENGVNYHYNMRSLDEHLRMIKRLSQVKGRWILSSYEWMEKHIRKIIPDAYVHKVSSYSGMKKRKHAEERVKNEEILVANFPPTDEFMYDLERKASEEKSAQDEASIPLLIAPS